MEKFLEELKVHKLDREDNPILIRWEKAIKELEEQIQDKKEWESIQETLVIVTAKISRQVYKEGLENFVRSTKNSK